MLLFSNEAGRKEYKSLPSGPKPFLSCIFPSASSNDHTHRDLLLSAGVQGKLSKHGRVRHTVSEHIINITARLRGAQIRDIEDLQGGQ